MIAPASLQAVSIVDSNKFNQVMSPTSRCAAQPVLDPSAPAKVIDGPQPPAKSHIGQRPTLIQGMAAWLGDKLEIYQSRVAWPDSAPSPPFFKHVSNADGDIGLWKAHISEANTSLGREE